MWTPTALKSEAFQKSGTIWRVVEDQHTVSTRKLVDTKNEQELLEELLEESKPPVPRSAKNLHYLLQTPFRYDAPYPVGSRFRRSGSTEGAFYASNEIRTALAELCYYRLRFFKESPKTTFPHQEERLTLFSVNYRSHRVIDLTRPPFSKDRNIWVDPDHYQATQAFSDSARQTGIEAICYESVRDTEQGKNVVLLSPRAFSSHKPKTMQTWFLYLSDTEANCERTYASHSNEKWTFKHK